MSTQETSDLIYIKASCHCRSNTFLIPFSKSKLPISSDLCHCNTCRHSSGQLGAFYASFTGIPLAFDQNQNEREGLGKGEGEELTLNTTIPANLENLIEYKSSPISSRLFCKTCGAHMLWHYNSLSLLSSSSFSTLEALDIAKKFNVNVTALPGSVNGPKEYWAVAGGMLERIDGIAQVDYHIYVEDTKDGGLADHFRGVKGEEDLKRWAGQPEESELLPRGWKAADINSGENDEKLKFYCHCGGVEGYITRPKAREVKVEEWWAPKGDKFFAGQCGCESCRKTSGFEINSWGLFPVENVQDQSGEIDFKKEDILGLKLYKSSTGCRRYFCGKCGATVFFLGEVRPEVVDVGLGLVDESRAGARAEGWFNWHPKVVFGDLMLNSRSRACVEYGL